MTAATTDKDSAPPPKEATGLDAAAERIRSTARWMVVTFGAVAGALLVGVQLSSLNDVTGADRTRALWGCVLGIGGVLLIVVAAAVVLTAGRVTLQSMKGRGGPLSLRRRLGEMEDLYPGWRSLDEMVRDVQTTLAQRTKTWAAAQADPHDAAKAQAYADARARAKRLVPIASRLLAIAGFESLRRTWNVARGLIVAGAIAAAVGVVLFAANVEQSDPARPAVTPQRPVLAVATLTGHGLATHRAQLGAACKGRDMTVIVTASDERSWSVTVVPTRAQRCGPAQITLHRRDGSVQASEPVDLG